MSGYREVQKELVTPSGRYVRFYYRDWQGNTTLRRFSPRSIFWGSNRRHPDPCWLLSGQEVPLEAPGTIAWRRQTELALSGVLPWDPVNDPQAHMVIFKRGRETERHSVGQGYNAMRTVLAVKEIDPDSNLVNAEKEGGRRRVFYVTDSARVKTSCWLSGWKRWARGAERAYWDGEQSDHDLLGKHGGWGPSS